MITLLPSFKLEHVVVRAADPAGKAPTNQGTGVINRALPLIRVEKLACFAENRISFAPQNPFAPPGRGESLCRRFVVYPKMIGEFLNVTLCDLHSLVD